MTNYISADLNRILHKQSFLNAISTFLVLFVVLVFIYFNPSFTAEMYITKVTSFLSFFPLIIGVFVFISVYIDDFKCKSMQVAIGYGLSRSRVIIAKLLESILLLFTTAVIMGILILCTPIVIGFTPNTKHLMLLSLAMATEMLRAIGSIALSTIPVFLAQDTISGIIVYVLLSSKTIYILLSVILGQEFLTNVMGDLTQYLYTSQLYTIKTELIRGNSWILLLIVALMIYIILPTIIAIIGFHKKELKF